MPASTRPRERGARASFLTTYLLAALLILLKVTGVLLAVLVGLVILLISLPVRARLSLDVAAERLLEGIFDEDAMPLFRVTGRDGDEREPDDGIVPVETCYELVLVPLGGIAEVCVASGAGARLTVMGVRFRLGGRHKRESPPQTGPGPTPQEEPVGRGARRLRARLARLREYLAPEVREKTIASLKVLFRALHFEGDLDVECGFPDPGFTGMTYAAYVALGGASSFGGVRFRPNFQGEMVDARGTVQLTLVPARLAWIVGRFLLSREIRPLWRRRKRSAEASAAGDQAKPVLQDGDG